MKKGKVKAKQYGTVHCYAQCWECGFDASMLTEQADTPADVRRLVRQHVLKTGHRVTIESGTSTDYSLEATQ